MITACKEWAVICKALASGRQTLILRGGGISEPEGDFRPEFREFLLFPTRFHQSSDGVVAEGKPLMQALMNEKRDDRVVVFTHYAIATDVFPIESMAALKSLRPYHIWSDAVVEERFHRDNKERLCALVLRVYALARPVTLDVKESYAGCRSWVELEADVPIFGAVPVLSDLAYAGIVSAMRASLRHACLRGHRNSSVPHPSAAPTDGAPRLGEQLN